MKKFLLAVSFLLATLTLFILPVTANATANNVSVNTAVATSSTNSSKCIYPANLGKNTSTVNSSVEPRTTTKASQATVTDEQSEKPGTATTDNQSEKLETATTDEQSEKPNTVTTNDQSQKPATVTSDVTKTQTPTAKAEKTEPNHSNESFKEAVAPAVFVPEISYKSGETGKDVSSDVKVFQTLYDPEGNVIADNYTKNIYDQESLKLSSQFFVSDDAVGNIKNNDYFSVSLPDALNFTDTQTKDLLYGTVKVGSFKLVKVGNKKLLKVTFNDYLENNPGAKDVKGFIDTYGLAKTGQNENVSYQQGGITTINVQPKPGGSVSDGPYINKGPIEKEGYQVTDSHGVPTGEINWTLNVNIDGLAEALETGNVSQDHMMKNAMVYDNLGLGEIVDPNSKLSLNVPIYFRDKDGNVLNTTGVQMGVKFGNEVTLDEVATANNESAADVTFAQFNAYIKSNLGSYGFFKQTEDGNLSSLLDQNIQDDQIGNATQYKTDQYTFVMNIGDLGVKGDTGNKLSLLPTVEGNSYPKQIKDNFPKQGSADLDKTIDGYQKLLEATGNSGIAGLHIEFRMKEDASKSHYLFNTAIVAHDNTSNQSNDFSILYNGTKSGIDLKIAKGHILIKKEGTNQNSDGTYPNLANVKFDVTDEKGNVIHLTTGPDGIAQTDELSVGEYLITETDSAPGYSKLMLANAGGELLGDGKTWKVEITRDAVNGVLVNVFNKKKETTNVNVTKTWQGVPAGETTPEVTVTLYANGKSTGKTLTLTSDNQYKGSFTDLDQTDANGKTIQYNVVEESKNLASYIAGNFGVAKVANGVYTLTNVYKPKKTNVNVAKTWQGVPAGETTPDVTVTLYANGKSTGKTLTLTNDNQYQGSFTDLDQTDANGKAIQYNVVEESKNFQAGYVAGNFGVAKVANGVY